MTTTLALATRNTGKLREIANLIGHIVTLQSLDIDVDEVGETMEENAVLKAEAALARSGLPGLGDDSGLEVSALDGRPGVRSARYAGENATDAENIVRLLSEMRGVRERRRGARFRCVLALAWPGEPVRTFEGVCRGRILQAPRGESGFGYDPVFLVPGLGQSFAELPPDEKNRISHRGRAVALLRSWLEARLSGS